MDREMDSVIEGSVELDWRGERWRLLPGRAAYRERGGSLIIADPHFGKAATFRAAGIHCPEPIAADLGRLSAMLEATGAERLVVLGDLFHSAASMSPSVLDALVAWRETWEGVTVTLVRGNHDRAAGDPPARLGMQVVDEGAAAEGVVLCHDAEGPAATAFGGAATLAGHVHPAVSLPDAGRVSVRLPCFVVGDRCMVLPAFGSFTGMHTVRRRGHDRFFAVAPGRVFEVPPGGVGRRGA
jgi:DNA ligase-associated metallophosphoesterase